MRAIWKGRIHFGLLSFPVTVHAATSPAERVSFRLLHRKDMAPVKNQRVCSLDGEVLEWDDIVKGYEFAKGQFAPVEKDEIESAKDGSTNQIELLEFVPRSSIDPMAFDTPYYLRPDRAAERAYTVLHDAMAKRDVVGVARFSTRGRAHVAALHIEKEAIAMTTLRPFEELRDVAEVDVPVRSPKPEEVDAAEDLVANMMAEWQPSQFHDEYRARLKDLVERKIPKATLRELQTAKHAAAEGGVDLVDALRRSVSAGRGATKRSTADESKTSARRAAAKRRVPSARSRKRGA